MPAVPAQTQPQRRRRTDTVVETCMLKRATDAILMHYRPPGRQGVRLFIEWLVANYDARAQGMAPLPPLPHAARGGMPRVKVAPPSQDRRRADVTKRNITMSRHTSEIFHSYCPPGRSKSSFLSELLFEHKVCEEVMERVREDVRTIVAEASAEVDREEKHRP
jgi:hypothetical protein